MTTGLRIAILIPTTGGCGQIIRLDPRNRLSASMVIPHDDYRPVREMSEAYDHLTRPGGVLDRFLGPDSAVRFKLIIKDPPDTGNSWEMPIALTHCVQHAGHQIVTENPDLVLWASGSLDAQGAILDQQYHVSHKLHHSADILHAYASQGAEIAFLLPHGQGQEGVASLGPLRSYSTHPVSSLEQAVHLLGATAETTDHAARKPRLRRAAITGAFVLVAFGLVALAALFLPIAYPKPGNSEDTRAVIDQIASAPDPEPVLSAAVLPEVETSSSRITPPEDILFAISILPRAEVPVYNEMEKERDLRGDLLSVGFNIADIRDLTCHATPVADDEIEFRIDLPCTMRASAVGEPDPYNFRMRTIDMDFCFDEIGACVTKPILFILP
ncbi:hypothetical protein [Roseinatronobacter sp. NSM]|uniref:hypothetical protein n=1 Tax=Roseinatronobacter sp. NSM TaxID=3457785 RepID=UPI004036235D